MKNTETKYNYRQPPPPDYVDPEGRKHNGEPEVIRETDGVRLLSTLTTVRYEWQHGDWWAPIPPTPPITDRYQVHTSSEDANFKYFRVCDMDNGVVVADKITDMDTAKFIANALEFRGANEGH